MRPRHQPAQIAPSPFRERAKYAQGYPGPRSARCYAVCEQARSYEERVRRACRSELARERCLGVGQALRLTPLPLPNPPPEGGGDRMVQDETSASAGADGPLSLQGEGERAKHAQGYPGPRSARCRAVREQARSYEERVRRACRSELAREWCLGVGQALRLTPLPLRNPPPEGGGGRMVQDEASASAGTICPLSLRERAGVRGTRKHGYPRRPPPT